MNYSSTTSDHLPVLARFSFGDVATQIERVEQALTEFSLYQNYPNPFQLDTTIRFSITRPGNVKLEIWNILGQKVTTLVNGRLTQGSYDISWSGQDDSGKSVSSGPYIYQLVMYDDHNARYSSTSKMLMLLD